MEADRVLHPIAPVFDKDSRILILGSFPSVKSREQGFFYGHPRNRFWKLISEICGSQEAKLTEDKKKLLLDNHIALWDVIGECTITGSSDASIRDVRVNDIELIVKEARIEQIFCNGAKAYELYRKYLMPLLKREAVKLPSTSPANAAASFEELLSVWRAAIGDYILPRVFSYYSIYEAVKKIPKGFVATYGQVAAMAGNGKGARVVGNALHVNPQPDIIPCYRVVNSKGKLTGAFAFGGINVQKELLEADGIEVINYQVDLKEYGI